MSELTARDRKVLEESGMADAITNPNTNHKKIFLELLQRRLDKIEDPIDDDIEEQAIYAITASEYPEKKKVKAYAAKKGIDFKNILILGGLLLMDIFLREQETKSDSY